MDALHLHLRESKSLSRTHRDAAPRIEKGQNGPNQSKMNRHTYCNTLRSKLQGELFTVFPSNTRVFMKYCSGTLNKGRSVLFLTIVPCCSGRRPLPFPYPGVTTSRPPLPPALKLRWTHEGRRVHDANCQPMPGGQADLAKGEALVVAIVFFSGGPEVCDA